MLISQFNKPTCINRMNSSQDKETIYLLEDCDEICKSKIKEAEVIPNSKNIFLNRITVECFDYMNGSEEKEFFINDLKSIFYFVKIINTCNKEGNEMNFLVLKEQINNSSNLIHDEEYEILNKINNKACLGNKIKKVLNIDEFPLENYILKKEEEKPTLLFLVGGYDKKRKKGLIKLYKVIKKDFEYTIKFVNNINISYINKGYKFKGPISSITQIKQFLLITCLKDVYKIEFDII